MINQVILKDCTFKLLGRVPRGFLDAKKEEIETSFSKI